MTEWAVRDSEGILLLNPLMFYICFFFGFQKYAATLSKQLGLRGKPHGKLGDDLDEETIQLLKDDQIVQLYELMLATKNLEDEMK